MIAQYYRTIRNTTTTRQYSLLQLAMQPKQAENNDHIHSFTTMCTTLRMWKDHQ